MDSEQDRNPSPPPEILDNEDLVPDKIGDSIYSKKWLYQALMDIVKSCDMPPQATQEVQKPESLSNSDAEAMESQENSKSDMVELDPIIEEKACTVWDMSTSKDVAEFMNEIGVPGIILDVMERTRSPRLLEIVVGILGNMSSYDSVCKSISENKSLLLSILQISGTSDAPTILQIMRVIRCGVRNKCSQAMWIEAVDSNPFIFTNFKFIFENSLNGTVINATYEVLYEILSAKFQYKIAWAETPFLSSLIEGAKQLQLLKLETKHNTFFTVLNCLCEYPPHLCKLAEHWTDLNPLFTSYFLSIDEEDPISIDKAYLNGMFACFDTFKDIVRLETISRELIFPDIRVLKSMCKLACSVNSMVLKVWKDNMNPEHEPIDEPGLRYWLRREVSNGGKSCIDYMDSYEFQSWKCLGNAIVETAKALLPYAEKDEDKDILNDTINSEVEKENVNGVII
ncbi:hypothetical protein JTE90_006219 [Oedothorax gibbosus]|uniref:Protein SAAL1 n=1 Tax=Oedothorax gibbosus TaxID=931172 RepID=A0AAV6VTW8_9ARAC|nr:hypothetical protein JTE90_006219 [Oedothorax gibbosus]